MFGLLPTKYWHKLVFERCEHNGRVTYCSSKSSIKQSTATGRLEAVLVDRADDASCDIVEPAGLRWAAGMDVSWFFGSRTIGTLKAIRESSDERTSGVIQLDSHSALGRDAAFLCSVGVLRPAIEFSQFDAKGESLGDGWHVQEAVVTRLGLVADPRNIRFAKTLKADYFESVAGRMIRGVKRFAEYSPPPDELWLRSLAYMDARDRPAVRNHLSEYVRQLKCICGNSN